MDWHSEAGGEGTTPSASESWSQGRPRPGQRESAPGYLMAGPLGGLVDVEQRYDLLRSAHAHTSHLPSGVANPERLGSLGRERSGSETIAQKAPHRWGKSDAIGQSVAYQCALISSFKTA